MRALAPPRRSSERTSWPATRRVIWGSADAAAAASRLRAMGFPRGACELALQIAGEVDAESRLAAASEWLLQHVEALGCDDDGDAARALEAANPWALAAGADDAVVAVDVAAARGATKPLPSLGRKPRSCGARRWRRRVNSHLLESLAHGARNVRDLARAVGYDGMWRASLGYD